MRTRHPAGGRPLPYGLVLIYEDRDILVVDKPTGLLSVSTDRPTERTAYFAMMDYVRKGNPKSRNRVFIVHRLDRDTSGILLLAKSEDAKRRLQSGWDETEKRYLAVVRGKLAQPSGTISTYLAENSAQVVYSTPDPSRGKLSHTAYRVVRQAKSVALLEIDLLTGRKNQIRAHLSEAGFPIVGDGKYGASAEPRGPLALHALAISFNHPHHGRRVAFSTPIPDRFHHLVGPIAEADLVRPPVPGSE